MSYPLMLIGSPAGPFCTSLGQGNPQPDELKIPRMDTPSNGDALSFATDIKPLFREHDQQAMARAFDLWSLDDVRTNAERILAAVKRGSMPCDGAWPSEQVEVLERWVDGGMAP